MSAAVEMPGGWRLRWCPRLREVTLSRAGELLVVPLGALVVVSVTWFAREVSK